MEKQMWERRDKGEALNQALEDCFCHISTVQVCAVVLQQYFMSSCWFFLNCSHEIPKVLAVNSALVIFLGSSLQNAIPFLSYQMFNQLLHGELFFCWESTTLFFIFHNHIKAPFFITSKINVHELSDNKQIKKYKWANFYCFHIKYVVHTHPVWKAVTWNANCCMMVNWAQFITFANFLDDCHELSWINTFKESSPKPDMLLKYGQSFRSEWSNLE